MRVGDRTFTLAGMDTTSNALSRILHQLALHPDAQDKLRAELMEAQGDPDGDADMTYEQLEKLSYLDAVCRETLRVFAPVTLSGRVSVPVQVSLLALLARTQRLGTDAVTAG